MNSVSVKGVIKKNNSFLLRKNERNEYELLGGKLEKDDINLRNRLKKEFLDCMDDDLNTADAISKVYELIRYTNTFDENTDLKVVKG